MGTQICTRCKVEKPLNEYHKQSRNKNRIRAICKECTNKERKERYWNREPLEKQLEILARGILDRANGRMGKKWYFDRGIECRIGESRAEVMNYLREHFSEDIEAMLNRGEQVSVDRIDSAGHYEAGNIRIMEFKENALRGSMTARKLTSHAVVIEDIKTGEITKAPSIREATKIIGCSRGASRHHLKRNNPSPIYGRYTITRESE